MILSVSSFSWGTRTLLGEMGEGRGHPALSRRASHKNPYEILFDEFLKRKYEDTDEEKGGARTAISTHTRSALNRLFNQEVDVFKTKSKMP